MPDFENVILDNESLPIAYKHSYREKLKENQINSFYIPETFRNVLGTDISFAVGKIYRIVAIGASIFEGWDNLQTVIIPDSVIQIGDSAFKDCVRLSSIVISKSVKRIESSAFENCIALRVTVPSTVEYIAPNAFENVELVTYDGDLSGAPWGAKNLKSKNSDKLKRI